MGPLDANQMRIGRLLESDFDDIIAAAGGHRLPIPPGAAIAENTDYLLGNAIIELKLVEEEGLEKSNRQRKVAEIFAEAQPNRPVVIVRPEMLGTVARREYFKAMANPIKKAVTKASRQLKQSAQDLGGDPTRVLLLVNNGYASLSHTEFKEIAIDRACNDTLSTDLVLIAGLYFYSDGFDMYLFAHMDPFPLHADRPFNKFEALRGQWHRFTERLLTATIRGESVRTDTRLPVQELTFELDGVRFVKPAPSIGAPSSFYVKGRPRRNTAGRPDDPPVARSFPNLDACSWEQFNEVRSWDKLSWNDFLKDSYGEWLRFRETTRTELNSPTMPFIPVTVDFDGWSQWRNDANRQPSVQSLCYYANDVFQNKVCRIGASARERRANTVVPSRYVLLINERIGQDEANDLCSIFVIDEALDGEHRRPIIENERMVFLRGLALASAYALKHGIGSVLYEKDLTQAWL